jgi:hypothetical protein
MPRRAEAGQCAASWEESALAIEVEPTSTLNFRPSYCVLRLAGWYALRVALLDQPRVDVSLLCQQSSEGERSLTIRYHGAPVSDAPLTDLVDPFHTGSREDATTVSYSFVSPRGLSRYPFERGEIRFYHPPRPRLETPPDDRYVEIGMDLHFEGNRRFRAALRICPSYERTGPVSDPVN